MGGFSPSYLNAMRSGLFGPAPPAPGAAVAPAMAGIPGTPGASQNAAIATAQAPAAQQAYLNQFGPLLGGSSMSGLPGGGPGSTLNQAYMAANPAPSFQQALAAMRGMNSGAFGGAPAMSGMSPLTGMAPNAAMINPMPANPFAARIAGLGGMLSGSPYGGFGNAAAGAPYVGGPNPFFSGLFGGGGQSPYAGVSPGFNPFAMTRRFGMF